MPQLRFGRTRRAEQSVTRRRAVLRAGVGVAVLLGGTAVAGLAWSRASAGAVRPSFQTNRQLIYKLSYRDEGADRVGAVFGAGNAGSQRFTTSVDAILTATTVESDARGATIVWKLVEPRVALRSGDPLEGVYDSMLRSDALRPFVTRVDERGRVLQFARDEQMGQLGAGLMRRIVATLQIVTPESGARGSEDWASDEPSVDGTRRSTYRLDPWVTPLFGDRAVRFHRTSAITQQPSEDDGAAHVVSTSLDDGRWRLDGILASLSAFELRSVRVNRRIVARSQALMRVDLVATPDLAPDRVDAARTYADKRLAHGATPLRVVHDSVAETRRARASVLATDTPATLERKLAKEEGRAVNPGQTQLAAQFGALFALQPASIAREHARFESAAPASAAFAVILQGLESAGTPQAQAELAAVAVRREAEAPIATPIAIGLGLQRRPTLQAESALFELALHGDAEVRDAAVLGLGSAASAEQRAGAARGARIAAWLVARLRAARTAPDRRTDLLALGNAGDPGTVEEVAGFAADSNSSVRAAVATALRHFEDARSDAILTVLLGDTDVNVRVAAAAAFETRAPGDAAFARLTSAATGDAASIVRASAAQALWEQRDARPNVRQVIDAVAAHDADSQVRATARQMLANDFANSEPGVTAPEAQLDPAR